MADISEQLLDAMEIIATSAVSNLKYDRTIRTTIYAVINVDTGIYLVKFEGNILTAYAEDLTKLYKVDEDVYVKVPEGDFSNKKIITGRVTELSLSLGLLNLLSNSVIDISPTFDTIYSFDTNSPWKVVAGAPLTEVDLGIDYIFGSAEHQYSATQYHGLFQLYANLYEYIKVKAEFKTQFHDVHTVGNYGLEIAFFAKSLTDDEVETVTCRLDFESESFNGDPYSYSVFSPLQLIFKTLTNYLLGLKYIRLFQEDFEYDTMVTDYDTGDRAAITVPNIFVQNVEINYVDVVDLTQETYYCYVAAPSGSVFSSLTPSIVLEARLLSYGELIASSNCTYKWFKRDLSVLVGNELYDKDAGFSWAPVGTGTPQLTLSQSDVLYQLEYKCIVTYNDVVMTGEKTVINSLSLYDYGIELVTENETIKLLLVNNKTDDILTGNWYISYPDNAYTEFADGKDTNSIIVKDYLTYTSLTFYCEVYTYDKNKISGVVQHTIYYSESEDDLSISYSGEDTFRYDANGDITIDDAEQERTLLISLSWKEGYGTSYKVEWLWKGEEVPRSKPGLYPDDSMMEDIWVDTSNILHYNIKSKYKINFTNNTLTVKVTTIDGTVYTFDKEILFVKDGDLGTNGTSYVAMVKACGTDGTKLSGFLALRYYNDSWQENMNLRCYVYKDGEFINESSDYTITYKWEAIGVSLRSAVNWLTELLDNDSVEQVVVVGEGVIPDVSANLLRYVKVTTRISDGINDRSVIIYTLFPIDVIYGSLIVPSLVDINDIPSYIKYTSSGLSPSFYNYNISFIYDGIDYTDSGVSTLTPDILTITEQDGYKYLKPASSFIFESDSIGLLLLDYIDNEYIIHPVIVYLDTYGNETINGWDGTKLDITNGYYYIKDGKKIYLSPDQESEIVTERITIDNEDYNYWILINGEKKGVVEGEAHVFAPQVGAGTKDSSNRFTGVVMGKDSGLDKIGLYGYLSGANTFGLTEDGVAYFGLAGTSGRIEIDGTNGTITSGNYTDTSGTMIDLSKGHIDSYNFYLTSKNMTLNSLKGSFEFRLGNSKDNNDQDTERDNSLFNIYFNEGEYDYGDGTVTVDKETSVFLIKAKLYYLLTLDYDGSSKGTKIDLAKGKITSYDFTLSTPALKIESGTDGNGEFSFDVYNGGTFRVYSSENKRNLFYIHGTSSNANYYLQSYNYDGSSNGTRIDLAKGKITSYTFTLDTGYLTMSSDDYGIFTLDVLTKGKFVISSDSKKLIYILGGSSIKGSTSDNSTKVDVDSSNEEEVYVGNDSTSDGSGVFYLLSDNYSNSGKTGTKIDLANGRITSYTFTLKSDYITMSSDSSGIFVINVTNNGKFLVRGNNTTLMNVSENSYYLLSANFEYPNSSGGVTGVKIDLKGTNSYFGGTITANLGKIGNWIISDGRLLNSSGSIYLSTEGTYCIKAGDNFTVTQDGTLSATGGNFDGTITATNGTIGGWTITKTSLSCGDTYLYGSSSTSSNRIVVGSNFIVDLSGNITANGGTIGGWSIGKTQLSSGKTALSSEGGVQTNIIKIYDNINSNSSNTLLGSFGYVEGQNESGRVTNNIGISVPEDGSGGESIILTSYHNIALRGYYDATNEYNTLNCDSILLQSDVLRAYAPPTQQYGIYARFA